MTQAEGHVHEQTEQIKATEVCSSVSSGSRFWSGWGQIPVVEQVQLTLKTCKQTVRKAAGFLYTDPGHPIPQPRAKP